MINILILDDEHTGHEENQKDLWESFCEKNKTDANIYIYTSPNLLLEEISKFALNSLLILDLEMSERDGLDVLNIIRKRNIHIPIIVYSGTIESYMYSDMAKQNLFTYVEKPNRTILYDAVKRAIQLLDDAIPLELSDAVNEFVNRIPSRKEKMIRTRDGHSISLGQLADAINKNEDIGIDYQKALYKMSIQALIDGDKEI